MPVVLIGRLVLADPRKNRRTTVRRSLLAALTVCVAFGAILVVATPAQASGVCNTRARVKVIAGIDGSAEIPTNAPYVAGLTCDLYQGVENDAVQVLQESLNDCYSTYLRYGISGSGLSYPGALLDEDGQFGPNTFKGLRLAQYFEVHTNGVDMPVDGRYGQKTRDALHWSGRWSSPNGNMVSGCSRAAQPLVFYSYTPPPPPPPVTKHNEVTSDWENWASPIQWWDITGWVTATMAGDRKSLQVDWGWRINPDPEGMPLRMAYAKFEFYVDDCTDNSSIEYHEKWYLTEIEDQSGGESGLTYALNPNHQYRIMLFPDGVLHAQIVPWQTIDRHFSGSVPPYSGIVPLKVDIDCF
jgi:hypothetical protein